MFSNFIFNSITKIQKDPGVICRVLKMCDDKSLKENGIDKKAWFKLDSVKIKVLNPDKVVFRTPLQKNENTMISTVCEKLLPFSV